MVIDLQLILTWDVGKINRDGEPPRTAVLKGHDRSKLGAWQLKSEITLFLMPFLLELHTFDTRASRINPIIIVCIRIIFVTPGSVKGGIWKSPWTDPRTRGSWRVSKSRWARLFLNGLMNTSTLVGIAVAWLRCYELKEHVFQSKIKFANSL
jgi:hypothetical protein